MIYKIIIRTNYPDSTMLIADFCRIQVTMLIVLNILNIVNELSVLTSSYEVVCMISYQSFYNTLFKKGITEYQLIHVHGISANTLHRMKKGEPITTKTIDKLCYILNCEVGVIITHDKTHPED